MVITRGQMDSKRNFYEVDYDPSEQSEQKPKKKQNVSERSSHMEEQVQPITDEDELDYILNMMNELFGDNDEFDDGLFAQLDNYKWDPVKGVLIQYKQENKTFEYFQPFVWCIKRLSNTVMPFIVQQ